MIDPSPQISNKLLQRNKRLLLSHSAFQILALLLFFNMFLVILFFEVTI